MAQLTNTQFLEEAELLFPTNGVGAISAADIRAHFTNTADSVPFKTTGRAFPPSANDDASNTAGNGGFEISDFWIDEANDIAYICLDNSTGAAIWANLATAGGNVAVSGVPVNNQLAVWTGADSIEGDANLLWNGTTLTVIGNTTVDGNITVTGTVDGRDVAADGSKLDTIESGAQVNVVSEIVDVTASRSLALTDANDFLEVDTTLGVVTLTIPDNATVAFPIATVINITLIDATNALNIAGDVGVLLNGVSAGSGAVDATAFSAVSMYKSGTDSWRITGNIGAIA